MSIKDVLHETERYGSTYLEIWPEDIDYSRGQPINIRLMGLAGDPIDPEGVNIILEFYEGKLQIHVWNGSEDAQTIIADLKPAFKKVMEANRKDLPLLISEVQDDADAARLLEMRIKQ